MYDYTSVTYKNIPKKCVRNKLKLFTVTFGHNKIVIGLSLMQHNAATGALIKQDINDL